MLSSINPWKQSPPEESPIFDSPEDKLPPDVELPPDDELLPEDELYKKWLLITV